MTGNITVASLGLRIVIWCVVRTLACHLASTVMRLCILGGVDDVHKCVSYRIKDAVISAVKGGLGSVEKVCRTGGGSR